MAISVPFWKTRTATILLVVLCGALGVASVRGMLRFRGAQAEVLRVEERIESTQREQGKLSAQLERMRAPAWLALLARQRLNWTLGGEQVAFVYKAEKSGIISQPNAPVDERSNWKKWMDWLLQSP